jgi:hypothetical protein
MTFNWLAIIVASLSTLVVGFIWYNPKVLGTLWMKSLNLKEEDLKKSNMGLIFGVATILAFMLSLFLTLYVQHGGEEHATFRHGSFHGALAGIFVILPAMVTNALFERRNFAYMAINVGYWIVCCSIMGGILCAWR